MVRHGASVYGATCSLMGEAVEVHRVLCCLVKLVRQDGAWALELNGDTSHLSQPEETTRWI